MTREVAEKYKFDIDPLMKVADLSVGQMQKVEIMKVLIKGAKIIIMDEPTAVLTPQENRRVVRAADPPQGKRPFHYFHLSQTGGGKADLYESYRTPPRILPRKL